MKRSAIATKLRKMLGIDDQQETITGLIREIEVMRGLIEAMSQGMSALSRRHNSLRREVEELGILATETRDLLGPTWTTKEGHTAPMAFLSISHLRNILAGGFGNDAVKEFAEREVERRAVDADWRECEAEGERAPTHKEMLSDVYAKTPEPTYQQRRNLAQMEESRGPMNFNLIEPGDEQLVLIALLRAMFSGQR